MITSSDANDQIKKNSYAKISLRGGDLGQARGKAEMLLKSIRSEPEYRKAVPHIERAIAGIKDGVQTKADYLAIRKSFLAAQRALQRAASRAKASVHSTREGQITWIQRNKSTMVGKAAGGWRFAIVTVGSSPPRGRAKSPWGEEKTFNRLGSVERGKQTMEKWFRSQESAGAILVSKLDEPDPDEGVLEDDDLGDNEIEMTNAIRLATGGVDVAPDDGVIEDEDPNDNDVKGAVLEYLREGIANERDRRTHERLRTQPGDGRTKSRGHLAFVGAFEYFVVKERYIYRAKRNIGYYDSQTGYKVNAREVAPVRLFNAATAARHGFTPAQIKTIGFPKGESRSKGY